VYIFYKCIKLLALLLLPFIQLVLLFFWLLWPGQVAFNCSFSVATPLAVCRLSSSRLFLFFSPTFQLCVRDSNNNHLRTPLVIILIYAFIAFCLLPPFCGRFIGFCRSSAEFVFFALTFAF